MNSNLIEKVNNTKLNNLQLLIITALVNGISCLEKKKDKDTKDKKLINQYTEDIERMVY